MSRTLKYVKAALLASVACLGAVGTASAQDSGSFYLDRAQISGAPDDPFMTWRPYIADEARFWGAVGLGYSLNPLRVGMLTDRSSVLRDAENPFSNQLFTYIHGGIQLSGRVGLDFMLPIALVNTGGEDPARHDLGNGLARGTAVYDTRVSLRLVGVVSDDKTFRWGGGGSLFAPTGDVAPFASDGETTSWIYTNLEYHLGDLMLLGMIGPQFRPQQGPAKSSLQVGNELRMSMGLFFPFFDEATTVGVELWGQTGIDKVEVRDNPNNTVDEEVSSFFRHENTPFEWLLQAKRNMGSEDPSSWYIQVGGGTRLTGGYGAADIRLLAQIGSHIPLSFFEPDAESPPRRSGDKTPLDQDPDRDGDGFPDFIDQCPDIKEDGKPPFKDDGCPDLDKDDDGILDKDDKCPTVPEDKDGVEDEDGCPEDDADGDGIKDEEDACVLVKGVKDEDPKKNGCPPQRKKIKVTKDRVELLEPIQFAYNEARILSVSFELMDEIAALMDSQRSMLLGVYGHTDNQGSAAYNKKLSTRRAASVVDYLANKGISRDRLESEGFGMEQPVAPNDTEGGRARNRRVEFKILRR